MKKHVWIKNFPCAITVCNRNGTILEMNSKAVDPFSKDGGKKLIGKNVLDCHPVKASAKLKKMLKSGMANVYTIEKNGIEKLVYQSPWFDAKGKYAGFVELVLPIPDKIPHFVRQS